MLKYLNGKTDAAIKKMTAMAFGVPEEAVTPEFLANEEREVALRRRRSGDALKSEFQAWRRARHSKPTNG